MKWICAGMAACFACAHAADTWSMDIVDELETLSQAGTQSNPWTASQGGTWCFTMNDTAWSYTNMPSDHLVGFYDDTRRYCCFLANLSTEKQSEAKPIAVNGKVGGRKILYHPKNGASTERLRYVAAISGTYAITGSVMRLSSSSSSNGITADVDVNGVSRVSVTSDTAAVSFAVSNVTLFANETIDLRLTANGAIANDATELSYVLVRTGDVQPPIAQTAAAALTAAATEPPVNPIVNYSDHPGTWGFYRRVSDVDTAFASRIDDYNAGLHAIGLGVSSSVTSYPRILVNTNSVDMSPHDAPAVVKPGEIFYHPEDGSAKETILRFTADRSGRYSFAVTGRDLNSGGGNGVNFTVRQQLANGIVLSARTQLLGKGETLTMADSDILLAAGDALELALDSNGGYGYDATALSFVVTFEEELTGVANYSATDAMLANCRQATPTVSGYVDASGGIWSYGVVSETDFAFTPFTTEAASGTFRGWSAATYLKLLVNTNGLAATCSSIGDIRADEMATHPDSKKAPTVRFTVPTDGLYRFSGRVRAFGTASAATGVEGRVVIDESAFVTSVVASANTTLGLPDEVSFVTEPVGVTKDSTVDFSLGPNGDYGWDASAVAWVVQRVGDLPTAPYVSFDICGTSRAPIAGAGRIGVPTDGAWTAVPCGRRRSLPGPVVAGERANVRLCLARTVESSAADGVATVLSDGVVSAGASDPVAFTVQGLVPQATYTFYAYSRNASGAQGVFTVGDGAYTASRTWFAHAGGDFCSFTAQADANGAVTGTFASATAGAASFCALQVTGEAFPAYRPAGTMLIIR